MLLSELLNARSVAARLKARTKRDAMAELVGLLEMGHGLETRGEVLDRVLRREAMMSTGIGNGVAIPHGKARSIDRMLAACAVSPEGIDFESSDGEPAYIFILLVSPENVGTPHVKVLANISRLLKEESVRRTLREAGTPAELLDALRTAESRYLPQPG
jgi:mannitol/fructose-specific phosphotransferase system IIA component (Ntr-type)